MIEARAEAVGAPLSALGRDFDAWRERGGVTFNTVSGDSERLIDLPEPGLIGPHQVDNGALAAAAMLALGHPAIGEVEIARGMGAATWPARMQRLTRGPLAAQAAMRGAELWLDGGHNPHAARALAELLGALNRKAERPLVLIAGMLANKDAEGYFAAFKTLAPRVLTVPFASEAAAPPPILAGLAGTAGLAASPAPDLDAAMAAALEGPTPPRIVICGSLYLAGEVLALDRGTLPD